MTAIVDKLRGTGRDPHDNLPVLTAADRREAADELERLTRENTRLRGALVTLSRYDDGLRASNWPGLADVVREALQSEQNGNEDER